VRPGYTAFSEVLATADVITLHCPLLPETQNLIGEAELRAMKSTALLINTARGGIVNEPALIRALQEGWIAGAGFDVITVEPPPVGHAMLAPELLALPNFLLTPHAAWTSRSAMQTLADQLIANIEAFVAGTPTNRVA
jgi:glycerate dehydrogenase